MSGLLAFPLAAAAALVLLPAAAANGDEGGVERRVLIDGRTLAGWQAVESSLAATTLGGEEALLFRVPVNWREGEPDYPVGWPRVQTSVSEDWCDWRKWDFLRLRIRALTDGDPLPRSPVGVTVSSGGHNSTWEAMAEGLSAGEWTEFAFQLQDLPYRDRVESVGLYISESNYRDGAVIEFYISNLELLHYREPTLTGIDSVPTAAFTDASALTFEVTMYGVRPGRTASVTLALKAGDRVVEQVTHWVNGETATVSLPLSAGLPPGDYYLLVTRGAREFSQRIRLVASPWQEPTQ